MKVYTKHLMRPLHMAEVIMHKYSEFPQYEVKEKIWKTNDNQRMHRIFLNSHFICDIITDEEVMIRAQENTIHVCNRNGHEYYVYDVKKGK